jgi:hypothetical protein
MKKLITLLLLFTLVGFLSGNQVVITNDYQYIVSEGKTYNFNNGNESNNVKYDRTNKIAIQNNKVLADPLKYHYAFFWDEADSFIGYYKTNKGITTSGAYLGQVNTQSIPLPLNAYSFALVRYDNDYILVNGFTIEELFIDNNLANVDPDDFNDIPIAELNGLTLNELFNDSNLIINGDFSNGTTNWTVANDSLSTTITNVSGELFVVPNIGFRKILNTSQLSSLTNDVIYTRYTGYAESNVLIIPYFRNGTNTSFPIISYGLQDMNFTTTKQNFSHLFTLGGNVGFLWIENASTVNYYLDNVYYINLTTLGLTSLTKATLDTYFNIYQNGVNATYYATDGNVSTVDVYYYASGKNLFKTDIEQGSISDTTGLNTGSGISARTIDFIPVKSPISLRQVSPTYFFVRAYFYDVNKNFISATTYNTGSNVNNISLPSGTNYLKLVYRRSDATSFTSSDITALKSILQLEAATSATTFEAFATPTTTLNLTFLFGVGNEPDKATMDGYYAEYEEYLEYLYVCCNIFATQTISFETIYFDDGVSTEIEAIGSILIFTIIGFTLMIFGFTSRRRLFNLLSIGAFVVLGFLLIEFVGFIIILFGLIFINVYYTFFGEL